MTGLRSLERVLGFAELDSDVATPPAANLRNFLLLIQLRWLAVLGQLVTIALAAYALHIDLPVSALVVVPLGLAVGNLASAQLVYHHRGAPPRVLLLALLIDVGALGWQLYLTGGARNPFAMLFLLQVVLGSVMLTTRAAALLLVLTSASFAVLAAASRPLDLPAESRGALLLAGSMVAFVLVALLLVLFVTRINRNLKARDRYLAELAQRAAEEVHIVRMGLLASGAAHELGTPLGSLAVILSDWARMPVFHADPELAEDIAAMQAEVERCKTIVTGILLSAGEARGEGAAPTTLRRFLSEVIAGWREAHPEVTVELSPGPSDPAIISDRALRQVFAVLFDNAAEAGAGRVAVSAACIHGEVAITVADDGRGFAPEVLARLGQPYQSTKARPGAGLGLFLLSNVMKTLGGAMEAGPRVGGGAQVRLTAPLSALASVEEDAP